MKLFIDIIYVLIENLIYVMYLDLFFKNKVPWIFDAF